MTKKGNKKERTVGNLNRRVEQKEKNIITPVIQKSPERYLTEMPLRKFLEKIIEVPPFQRKAPLWSAMIRNNFFISFAHGHVASPFVIGVLPDGTWWLLDGHQRLTELKRLVNNEVRYPLQRLDQIENGVSYDKNNGVLFKNLSSKDQTSFLDVTVTIMKYENGTKEDYHKIFLEIQNGLALTQGELIKGNYGNATTACGEILSKTEFDTLFKDKEGRALEYRIVNGMLMLETEFSKSIDKTSEIKFVEANYNQSLITPKHKEHVIKVIDSLIEVKNYENISFSFRRLIICYLFIIRIASMFNPKTVAIFLKQYYENESKCYDKHKTNAELTPNEMNYVLGRQTRLSSPTAIKIVVGHMCQEFDKFEQHSMKKY